MSTPLLGVLALALALVPDERCAPSANGGDAQGALAGIVLDARGTTPVPHAIVTVMWRTLVVDARALRTERHEAKARADSAGHFLVCGVPADVPVLAWAVEGDVRSIPAELTVPAGGELGMEFRIARVATAAATAAAPAPRPDDTLATLAGVVRDGAGAVIGEARVRVGTAEGLTDSLGRFDIAGIAPGEHRLEVLSLGWRPATAWVTLAPGERSTVEVAVDDRVSVLEPVRTVARRDAAARGFAERRRAGIGTFLDRDDIARRRAELPSDLLAGVGALERAGRGEDTGLTSNRGGGGCTPRVFLDGTPLLSSVSLDRHVSPSQIAGIEVYESAATAPAEYRGQARCGIVLVWSTTAAR